MSEEVAKTALDSKGPKHAPKPLRILLVEDHQDTRHTLSRLLTHFGHQISVAADRQSALHIMASQNFDVILCDIGLPDGSGYEVVSETKRRHRVKAIAISGFGTEADVRR